MFRQTSKEPITIDVDTGFLSDSGNTGIYETWIVDFINRTITVAGVTRPMTDKEKDFFPDEAQIDKFIAQDQASAAAQEAGANKPTADQLQSQIDQLQAQVDSLTNPS